MYKLKISGLIAIFAIVACVSGCENKINAPTPPEKPEASAPDRPSHEEMIKNCLKNAPAPTPYQFAGSKWKFVKLVDVETGESIELEPKECEECYTIVFDTDSTANVHRVSRDMKLDLSNLHPEALIEDILIIETYQSKDVSNDADKFFRSIKLTGSYTATTDELKLYYCYSNKLSYLLFKRIR
jgi:hypothetical protein